MSLSVEDANLIAKAIADANSPLRDARPDNARAILDNLIRHDSQFGARFMAGEAEATRVYNRLVELHVEHEKATRTAQLEQSKAAWNEELAKNPELKAIYEAKMEREQSARAAAEAHLGPLADNNSAQ